MHKGGSGVMMQMNKTKHQIINILCVIKHQKEGGVLIVITVTNAA